MPGSTVVAVQVVNYRTRRYLERCLETVVSDLESTALRYEINLLDNASGEDLADLAGSVANGRAFTAPANLGFGGGHNLLATETDASFHSTSDHVLRAAAFCSRIEVPRGRICPGMHPFPSAAPAQLQPQVSFWLETGPLLGVSFRV